MNRLLLFIVLLLALGLPRPGQANPGIPSELAATVGNTQLTLSWNTSPGSSSYNLYRSTTSGGEGSTPYQSGLTTSYTDTGLTNGTTYYYTVTGVGSSGTSGQSTEASGIPNVTPSAPMGLSGTPGDTTVILSWTASSGATSYKIYRAATAGGEGSTSLYTTTSTTYTDTGPSGSGLYNDTIYYYKVTAVNSAGESSKSSEASVTPLFSQLTLQTSSITVPGASTPVDLYLTTVATEFPVCGYNPNSDPYRIGPLGIAFTPEGLVIGDYCGPVFEIPDEDNQVVCENDDNAYDCGSNVLLPHLDSADTSSPADGMAMIPTGTDAGLYINSQSSYQVFRVDPTGISAPTSVASNEGSDMVNPTGMVVNPNDNDLIVSGGEDKTYLDDVNPSDGDITGWSGNDYSSADGITFTGDGSTLYYAVDTSPGGVVGVDAGTGDQTFNYSSYVTSCDAPVINRVSGVALGAGPLAGMLFASTNGTPASGETAAVPGQVWAIYLPNPCATGGTTLIASGGSRGDFVAVDPNGSLLITQSDEIFRLSAQPPAGFGDTLSISPTEVVGGATPTDTIATTTDNPGGNLTFTFSSDNSSVATGPSTLTVDEGNDEAIFTDGITTYPVATQTLVTFTATVNNYIHTATLLVDPPSIALTATAGNAQVALNWTDTSGATSYDVYRGTATGGEGSSPYLTGITTNAYTDASLANGTTYYYTVAAVIGGGTTPVSNEADATPEPPAPSAPTLSATGGNAQVTLNWTSESGATSYSVYRGLSSGGEGSSAITSVSTTTYTDESLTAGTAYYYEVTAVNGGGASAASNEASATTQPPAPTGLAATAGSAQVTLAWTASPGATGYNIYRATTSGGEGSTVLATSSGAAYTDLSAINGSTYYYTVAAVNAAGTSAQSNEAAATLIPSVPTLSATAGNAQVILGWTASAGATGYNVYRSTTSGGEGSTAYATSSTAAYTDASATNGTTYYYTAAAVNAGGTSAQSSEVSATPEPPVPGAPTLSATGGNAQITLNWSSSSGATSYSIYRGTTTGGEGGTPITSVTATAYTDAGLAPGTTYYYTATAVNGGGASTASNEASATTQAAAPMGLTATAGNAQVTLHWTASAGATGYNVYRSTTSGGEGSTAFGTSSGAAYTDTGAANGSTYYYTVAAVNAAGTSAQCSQVSATLIPAAPTGLAATGGSASVTLAWTASAGATGYNVYRSTTSGGEGTTAFGTSSGAAYTDTGAVNGSTYYYTVAAVNAAGTSAQCSQVSATLIPAAPTGLAATGGSASVTLGWTASPGATGYNVYRATTSGGEGTTAIGTSGGAAYTDTGLTNGVTYYYKVAAVNAGGTSTKSNEASATPLPTVLSVTLSPSSVQDESSSEATVTLASPAPSGGATVTLSASGTAASVQSSIVVAGGATTSAEFLVSTSAISSDTSSNITAAYNGSSQYATLTITTPPCSTAALDTAVGLYINTGVNPPTGMVTLVSGAALGGEAINLSSNNATVTVPPTVLVKATATTATFPIEEGPNGDSGFTTTITATYQGVPETATLSVPAIAASTAPSNAISDQFYVADSGAIPVDGEVTSQYISEVNLNSSPPTSTLITAGPEPYDLTVTSDDTQVLVPVPFADEQDAGYVQVVYPQDLLSDTSIYTNYSTKAQGWAPQSVRITPDGTTALVTNFLDQQTCGYSADGTGSVCGTVSFINMATHTVTNAATVGQGPNRIAISPDGQTAYVANFLSNTVSVIDIVSQSVTKDIVLGNSGEGAEGVAVSPDGGMLYVGHGPGNVTAAIPISAVNASSGSVFNTADSSSVTDIPVNTGGAEGMVFSPNGRTLYVDGDDGTAIAEVDTATNTVRGYIDPDAAPPTTGPSDLPTAPPALESTQLVAVDGSTQLAAGTYYVAYTWQDASGHQSPISQLTSSGQFASITITAGQEIEIEPTTATELPTNAVIADVYCSIVPVNTAVPYPPLGEIVNLGWHNVSGQAPGAGYFYIGTAPTGGLLTPGVGLTEAIGISADGSTLYYGTEANTIQYVDTATGAYQSSNSIAVGTDPETIAFAHVPTQAAALVYTRDDMEHPSTSGNGGSGPVTHDYTPFTVSDGSTPPLMDTSYEPASFDISGVSGTVTAAEVQRSGSLTAANSSPADVQLGIQSLETGTLPSLGPVVESVDTPGTPTNYPTSSGPAAWALSAPYLTDIDAWLNSGVYSVSLFDQLESACSNSSVMDVPHASWPIGKNLLTFTTTLTGTTGAPAPQGRSVDVIPVSTSTAEPTYGTWQILDNGFLVGSSGQMNGWNVEQDWTNYGGWTITVPPSAYVENSYTLNLNVSGAYETANFSVNAAGTSATAPVLLPFVIAPMPVNTTTAITTKVSLDAPAPVGGATVTLTAANTAAGSLSLTVNQNGTMVTTSLPTWTTIPAGQRSIPITVTPKSSPQVTTETAAIVQAEYNGYREATLVELPSSPTGLGQPSCTGGAISTGTNDGSPFGVDAPCGVGGSPSPPANLVATSNSNETVTLNWSSVSGALGYNVLRSASKTGPFATIFRDLSAPGYIDLNVVNGVTYYYVVVAVNLDGPSPYSNVASATPFAGQVAAPTFSVGGSTVTGGSYTNSVTVSIADASGTTIYYTLDGTTPTVDSPQYSSAVTLTGTTTVEAMAVENGYINSPVSVGTFDVTASSPPVPTIVTCDESPISGTLGSGDPWSVALGAGYYAQQYSLTGTAAQVFTLAMSSTTFATELFLFDPSGHQVASDTNYQGGPDSEIIYTLPISGNYTIEATSFYPQVAQAGYDGPLSAGGSYTLTPTCTTTPTAALQVASDTGALLPDSSSSGPSAYTYPDLYQGQTADEAFTITNTGTASLSLSSITISGSAYSEASGQGPSSPLAPGQSTQIVIQYTATGSTSSGTLSMATNDPNNTTYTLDLSGTGESVSGGVLDVEQGGSELITFTYTAGVPSGGWYILNPAGTIIGTDDSTYGSANGWNVTPYTEGTQVTVSAPSTATVANGYTVYFTAGTPDNAAPFNVIAMAAPDQPNISVANPSNGAVQLQWSPNAAGSAPTTYNLWRGTTTGGETQLVTGITAVAPTTSYTDTSVTNGDTYYYKVKAVDSAGTSTASNEVPAEPAATLWAIYGSTDAVVAVGGYGGGGSTYNLSQDSNNVTSSEPTAPTSTDWLEWGYTGSSPWKTSMGSGLLTWSTPGGTTYTDYNTGGGIYTDGCDLTWSGGPSSEETATSVNSAPTETFTAPADTSTRSLNFYSWGASSTLHASLSDGSASAVTITVAAADASWTNVIYKAGSSGQTLTVTWNPQYIQGVDLAGSSAAPTVPASLTGTAGNTTATLHWTASSQYVGESITYALYRGTTSGGEGTVPVQTGITGASYTDSGLTNGNTYYYKVAAVDTFGTSGNSSEVSVALTLPGPASNLVASGANAAVGLTWTAGYSATSYNIYRSTTEGGEGSTAYKTGITTAGYTDTAVTNGTTYYYNVLSENSHGNAEYVGGTADYSNEAYATPQYPPAAPTSLAANPGNAEVLLTWTPSAVSGSAGAAASYIIERGTSSGTYGTSFTQIAGPSSDTTETYLDTSAVNGTTYYYAVKAANVGGISSLSNQVSATPSIGLIGVPVIAATEASGQAIPPGGHYNGSSVSVTISSSTSGAVIYYTTNGTTPTSSSSHGSSPVSLTVSGTATVEAYATATSYAPSIVVTAAYTQNLAISVSLTAPTSGAVIQSGSNATVTASVTDTNTGATITGVNFYAGSNFIGSSTASPYTITWAQPVDGTYSLTATAIDSFDATGTSSGVSVTVGTPVPTQTIACGQTESGTLSVDDGTSWLWGPQHYANDFTFNVTSAPQWVVISQQSTALDSLATLYDWDATFSTNVTGATDANPIMITAANHGLTSGQPVTIAGAGGTNTNANGSYYAGNITTNTFKLYSNSGLTTQVDGNGTYSSGGTATATGAIPYTDLVIDSSGSASTVSSAAHPFQTTEAGEILEITGGTGFTPGIYAISSVNSSTHVATLSGNVGTNGSTAGVGTLAVVAYNDDSQGVPPDSQIVADLQATGTYTIEASSAAPYQTGPFTVTLTCPTSTPSATLLLNTPGSTIGSLEPVVSGTGTINMGSAIPAGVPVTETLTLQNAGTEDAAITSASTTGTGFSISAPPQIVKAGTQVTFTLSFIGSASESGALNIANTSGTNPYTVDLSATVVSAGTAVATSGGGLTLTQSSIGPAAAITIVGGTSATATVTLAGVPTSDQVVSLASADPSLVTFPGSVGTYSVTVPAGTSPPQETVTLTTAAVSAGQEPTIEIEASTPANTSGPVVANLTLLPPQGTAPTVTLATPTGNPSPTTISGVLTFGQGATISLTATPTAYTSGAHIAYVQYYGSLGGGTATLLGQQDEGVVSSGTTTYTFTWNGAAVGSWSVYAVATDTNGQASSDSNSEAFAVAVLPAAPTPSISPAGGSYTGEATFTITDSASEPTIYYTTASGTTNSNTPAEYTSPRYNGPITLGPGTYTVNAIAYAPGCAVSSEATETFTIASPTGAVPTTAITSPASGTITQGSAAFGVGGTVTCSAATTWELDYAQGNAPWTAFATGSLGTGGGSVSGNLDTTLLLNGQTQIRLLATTSGGQQSSVAITITIMGDLKVGYFTLSYNDMTVPVAGMPIQITRTYDSRDKSSGAFGVGWTLSTNNVQLYKSQAPIGDNWSQTESLLNYYVQPTTANYVSVTMPNGDTYNFAAEMNPPGQSLEPLEFGQVVFEPIGETNGKATLTPVGDSSVMLPSGLGAIDLLEDDGITTYDTDEFQMTMHNGSTLDIVKGQGLKWVSDTNGNTVYFNLTGTNPTISEQNVAGTTVRTVTIGLGGNGLITSITDPDGAINPDGHTVSYNNASGNLDSYTDQNGNTTSYEYDATHDLLQINAPNGARPIENSYDGNGRLTSSVDANNNTISYSYTTGSVTGITGSVGSETVTDRNGNSTRMVYDGNGNVIQTQNLGFVDSYGVAHGVKDANGSNGHIVTTSAVFGDPNNPNKPTSETDALSHVTTMSYTVAGDILTQSRAHTPAGGSAEQLVTAYTYDGNEHELTLQNPNNYGTSIFDEKKTYTLSGNVASSMDALGNTTNNAFNALGELVTVTNPNGGVASYTYDSSGDVASITDPAGATTNYTYDSAGNKLTESTVFANQLTGKSQTVVKQFEYDGSNNLISITVPADEQGDDAEGYTYYNSIEKVDHIVDVLGRTTYYTYDADGRLTQTTYPDGSTTKAIYDANGNPVAGADRMGRWKGTQYDALNRPVRTGPVSASSPIVSGLPNWLKDSSNNPIYATTYYNDDDTVSEEVDADGNLTTNMYDDLGRKMTEADGLGYLTSYTYDDDGNVISVTDPNGHTTSSGYDADNDPVMTMFPDGTTSTIGYDNLGCKAYEQDQDGYTTSYGYDADGRLLRVTTPLGYTTSYAYDQNGDKISQTDADGHTTRFAYDIRGRLAQKTMPLGQTDTVSYNLDNAIASSTDYNGYTTTYAYYPLTGKLSAVTPDSRLSESGMSYTYNADGTEATSTEGNVTETYGYDSNRGWLTSFETQIGSTSNTVSYTYDDAGNKLTVTSPYGTTHYGYDADNRISSVTASDSTATNYLYDFAGNLRELERPSGVDTIYKYNALDRLVGVQNSVGPSLSYVLDADGRRIDATDSVAGTTAYVFDADGRLTSETPPSGSPKTYGYDPTGNRIDNNETTWSYDSNNRLNSAGSTSYTYDSNGNATEIGSTSYSYDFANRMTGSGSDGFVYDADGNRVQATVGSVITNYVVDPTAGLPSVIEERNSSNSLVAHYEYGQKLLRMDRGGTAYYYVPDGLGSTRALEAGGSVTDTWSFDGFGNSTHTSGTDANAYLLDGQAQDATGLYYLRARYYNPADGRFLSQDPLSGDDSRPVTLNHYAYADDDPTNEVDPSGQQSWQPGLTAAPIGKYVHQRIGLDFTNFNTNMGRLSDRSIGTILTEDGVPGAAGASLKRPDLADVSDHFLMEIKPDSPRQFMIGLTQLSGYMNALNAARSAANMAPLWRRGNISDYWFTPILIPTPFSKTAVVFPPINGVILYQLVDPNLRLALKAYQGTIQQEVDMYQLNLSSDADAETDNVQDVARQSLTGVVGGGLAAQPISIAITNMLQKMLLSNPAEVVEQTEVLAPKVAGFEEGQMEADVADGVLL